MAKVLCITGMHRSGTSLTAGWLQRCGLQIDDGRLEPGNPSNPRGHFEDVDFYKLQDAALREIGPQSKGWIAFPDTFLSLPRQHRDQAKTFIEVRNAKYPVWGWKDPRTVVFLADWKEMIPGMKALLIWRSCAEVVASLLKRSRKDGRATHTGLSVTDAVHLWQHYSARVCDFKRLYSDDTVLVSLDYVLTQNRALVELLNHRFNLELRPEPLGDLYAPNLMERQPPLQARVMAAYPEVAEMEERLAKLSDASTSKSTHKPGHPLAKVFADETATHLYLVEQERKIDDMESTISTITTDQAARAFAAGEQERKINDLATDNHDKANKIQELEDRVQQAEARGQELTAKLQETEDRIQKSEARCQELTAKLTDAEDRVQQAEARCQELTAKLQETEDRVQQSDARIQELTAKLRETEDRVQKSEARGQELEDRVQKSEARGQELAGKLSEAEDRSQKSEDRSQQLQQQLQQQQQQFTAELDHLLKERNQLADERDQLTRNREHLTVERDQLIAEREQLSIQRYRLITERDALRKERDALAGARDWETTERARLTKERDALTWEQQVLTKRMDGILNSRTWRVVSLLHRVKKLFRK